MLFYLIQILKIYGYTQGALAELVSIRRETIVHLKNGNYNPSLKLAMDIAHVFGTTVEALFSFCRRLKKPPNFTLGAF